MEIKSEVKFVDENLKKAFLELESGKFQDKQLRIVLEWMTHKEYEERFNY